MADGHSNLDRTWVHRALSRPTLLFGADRELALLAGLASIILIFVVLTLVSAVMGVVIWIVAMGLLRMMAKADPNMRRIYLRYTKYRHYYRPTATPWRRY